MSDDKNDLKTLLKKAAKSITRAANKIGGASPASSSGATLAFGTADPIGVTPGGTIKATFDAHAEALGYDPLRQVIFRRDGEVVGGDTSVETGHAYTASVTYESKG